MSGILQKVCKFTFPHYAVTLVNAILFEYVWKKHILEAYIGGIANPSSRVSRLSFSPYFLDL